MPLSQSCGDLRQTTVDVQKTDVMIASSHQAYLLPDQRTVEFKPSKNIMPEAAEISNNSDKMLEIAPELFIPLGDQQPQQEAQQEFFIPPAEHQPREKFRLEDYVDFPPTLIRDPPLSANSIFCHCSLGAALASKGRGLFVTYRIRNGDVKYITNFLFRSIGPDPSFHRNREYWENLGQMRFEPHLVEIVSYRVSGIDIRGARVSYCALPDAGVKDKTKGGEGAGYDIVPVCLFGNTRFLRATGQHMVLETRWLISCKQCDKWYEVNVYR